MAWRIPLFKIYWDEEDVISVAEAIKSGMNAKNGVIIADYVQIGSHCSIYSVSTIDNKRGEVILKKGCRIGSHSVVIPGVTIGENSVVS